jgi:hypothetical protein
MDRAMTSPVSTAAHRTLKLHEWLVLLFLLILCNGVRAATAYKCVDASGAISFQPTACAASQHATEIELAPARPAAPSPQYAIDRTPSTSLRQRNVRIARAKTETAYECRTSGGDIFYRLSHCPHSIGEKSDGRRGASGSRGGTVSSHPVSRELACSEMQRAGAVGRKGHEYDESVSTYDRNLGKDPCK